ncbi:MAG: Mth938-like domain-containing protein [Gammaproteobacteria bacterium]|nr:Mth938-like domain-containing protein [Gammaproteobacteria bacterium]
MKFSEEQSAGSNVIRAYQHDQININGALFSQSLVLNDRQIIKDWPLTDINQLTAEHLAPILAMKPEVILIGTGQKLTFPPASSYASVIHQGIGIEFMDSGAACRTFNVLVSENRTVVAGIIL